MQESVWLRTKGECILEATGQAHGVPATIAAESVNYSDKGMTIRYVKGEIPRGTRFLVTIDSLNIFRKEAVVSWTKRSNGAFKSQLKWLHPKPISAKNI